MNSNINTGRFRHAFIIFFIIFCSGVVFLSFLSRPDNYTRKQVRTIICAREMVASGDYVIPTLGGETRFRKPPLPYWLITLTAKFNKGLITNTTSRIPSVIAGILILLLTWWWTLQLTEDKDPKKALLSLLVLLIIPLFFLDVRSSEAEIVLCFFILYAAYFFWKASTTIEVSRKNLMIAYLFVAGGMLTKGPLALLMPILPYIVIRKKSFLKEWKWHGLGLLIAILPVGLWVFAAYLSNPEAINIFIKELFTKRFGGEAKHEEPFYYYIILLAGHLAIFMPVLFLALKKTFKAKSENKFSLYFVLINLIWISMMSSKKRHYLIPMLPYISIILGVWLSEQSGKRWVFKYFTVVSYLLAVGVIVLGFLFFPKSVPILLAVLVAVIIVMFLPRHFMMPGLWKSAIFFLAVMHLGDLYVAYTGNRLLPEQLTANWLKKQPISKNKIVFVNRPNPLIAYYFDNINETVVENDKELSNRYDYFIVEGEDRIERFLKDKHFFLIKGVDKIRQGRKTHQIAFFGKTGEKHDEKFRYRLLFIEGDGNNNPLNTRRISDLDFKTFYAIVPEINPLVPLDLFSMNKRSKWVQTYLPILNQGVELICKFDPHSSLFRRTWFNDVSYWGTTPEVLQRRSFFNDRYFLWTLESTTKEKGMNQLEDELKTSSSALKFVFIQRSTSKENELSIESISRLKQHGAIIVNELLDDDSSSGVLTVGYDGVGIRTMGSNGQGITHQLNLPARQN